MRDTLEDAEDCAHCPRYIRRLKEGKPSPSARSMPRPSPSPTPKSYRSPLESQAMPPPSTPSAHTPRTPRQEMGSVRAATSDHYRSDDGGRWPGTLAEYCTYDNALTFPSQRSSGVSLGWAQHRERMGTSESHDLGSIARSTLSASQFTHFTPLRSIYTSTSRHTSIPPLSLTRLLVNPVDRTPEQPAQPIRRRPSAGTAGTHHRSLL